jgi:hypothetical protein
VNGKPLFTAGIRESGVLEANISSHLRSAEEASENHLPTKQLSLIIVGKSGSDVDVLSWPITKLAINDEILLRIVETDACDEPTRRMRDPVIAEGREREIYERLKRKFDLPLNPTPLLPNSEPRKE